MSLNDISKINVKNKLVLLRIDVNSPVVNGKIVESPRFKEASQTIKYLVNKKARVVILAHQGRKGNNDFASLREHARILSLHSKIKINYIDDLFGEIAKKSILMIKPGDANLLKNVRAYRDEMNAKNRYARFSRIFDLYVNDAFSVSHRRQNSIIIPPRVIPSYVGFNFHKELNALSKFNIKNSLFLIGGSKIEDDFPIFNILKNNSKLLASGVLANLFLVARGYDLGYENKWAKERGYYKFIPKLKEILRKHDEQIILPVDFAFGKKKRVERLLLQAPFKEKIWDVGSETADLFISHIKRAKSIFMKGPLGFSEIPIFSYSTVKILNEISKLSKEKKIFSILGGGHLTTTIKKYKIKNNFSYISTSGGALIHYLSGEKIPGIEALKSS